LLTPYLYTFSLYENPSFIIFSAEYVRSSMQNFDFFLIRLKHSHRGLFLFLLASETTSRNDVLFSTNNVCKIPPEFCHFVWVCQKTLPQSTRLVFTLHISNRWPIPAIVSLGFYLCQLSIGSIIFVVLVYFIDLFTRSIIFVVVWFYLVVHSLDPYVIICYVWTISFAYRLGWYIFVVFYLLLFIFYIF
jgi:hypothetical protein